MKLMKAPVVGLLLATFLLGCNNKSGLEGTVVDCKGNPRAGIRVIAKQVEPVVGYERFETTSEPDGYFLFDELYPNSAYELAAAANGATTAPLIKVESGSKGLTYNIPQPIKIRFYCSADGATVLDTKSGLMWARKANVAGRQMNWEEAMNWVQTVNIGGHRDWRLPAKEELEALFQSGGPTPQEFLDSQGFTSVPNPKNSWYWTSASYTVRSNYAWIIALWDGSASYDFKGRNYDVWPVRP